MKVAIIPPFDALDLADTGYHLLLPQLMVDSRYNEYAYNATGYKILDNGACEGALTNPAKLIDTACMLEVQEVIVPDVLGDHEKTLKHVRDFTKFVDRHPEFKYTAVVQGRDYDEVAACLWAYSMIDWIDYIALPRILVHHIDKWTRYALAQLIDTQFGERFPQVHCLGSSWWIEEVMWLSSRQNIRGMDTSMPCVLGLEGRALESGGKYERRQQDYFHQEVRPHDHVMMDHNVGLFIDWARDGRSDA